VQATQTSIKVLNAGYIVRIKDVKKGIFMTYFTLNKHGSRLVILSVSALFLSACATADHLAKEPQEPTEACPNFPGPENKCSFDYTSKQDLHAEYSQQLLPIDQREDIIEQELEDARNKH
jgi:hypothetical protein